MKISIIGAGNVGGTTALRLSLLGFKEIILIDSVPGLARAKAFDLNDARFIAQQDYYFTGTDDIKQIAKSQIIILTAGLARKPGMSREELAQKNSLIIKRICQQIKELSGQSIVIVVTNPLDVMTYLVLRETRFPARRIIGMGLSLDSSRLANLIAETLNIAASKVEPCIIGSHGAGMLPLIRYSKVSSKPLNKSLAPDKIDDIFKHTIQRGAEIVSLFGKGSAYFAPSAAIAELTKAVAFDEKRILPVSVFLDGEYGLKNICIGLPCSIGKNGIEKIISYELEENEKTAFLNSAESIKKQIAAIYNTGLQENRLRR
ncbi:MAG: malate dehydrogenase [Candidatus Omnitrophota bacterium]